MIEDKAGKPRTKAIPPENPVDAGAPRRGQEPAVLASNAERDAHGSIIWALMIEAQPAALY